MLFSSAIDCRIGIYYPLPALLLCNGLCNVKCRVKSNGLIRLHIFHTTIGGRRIVIAAAAPLQPHRCSRISRKSCRSRRSCRSHRSWRIHKSYFSSSYTIPPLLTGLWKSPLSNIISIESILKIEIVSLTFTKYVDWHFIYLLVSHSLSWLLLFNGGGLSLKIGSYEDHVLQVLQRVQSDRFKKSLFIFDLYLFTPFFHLRWSCHFPCKKYNSTLNSFLPSSLQPLL